MSLRAHEIDGETVIVEAPICDYCGEYIVDDEQVCPALHDGRCSP